MSYACPRFVWYSWTGVDTLSSLTLRATTPETRPAEYMRDVNVHVQGRIRAATGVSDVPMPAPPPVGGKPILVPVHDLKYTCQTHASQSPPSRRREPLEAVSLSDSSRKAFTPCSISGCTCGSGRIICPDAQHLLLHTHQSNSEMPSAAYGDVLEHDVGHIIRLQQSTSVSIRRSYVHQYGLLSLPLSA